MTWPLQEKFLEYPEALKKDGAVKAAAAQILIVEQTAKAGDLED